ncbi:glutamate--tRNA ligase [Planctomycetota bacterium]
MDKVRVRFAPSPTGYLHIGGARTALYNYLFARHHQGELILRIEDTDQVRSTDESCQAILDSLKWLGIDWDGEIYYQSQRRDIYKEYAERLLKDGKAVYDDDPTKGKAVIFKLKPDIKIRFKDLIHGIVEFDSKFVGDKIVLIKSDGFPTYNFACVVDDSLMKMTHIIRGDDHVSNTPKQVVLYEALGMPVPQFAHIPLIMGEDGSRLSKRHGHTAVMEYKEMGYLPEALFNFLALLGWSPGDDTEIMERAELIKRFTIERVKHTPAQFDMKKLTWLNNHYLKNLEVKKLAELVRPFMTEAGLDLGRLTEERFLKVVELYRERAKTLAEFPLVTKFLFTDEVSYDEKAYQKFLVKGNGKDVLTDVLKKLKGSDKFDLASLEEMLRAIGEERALKFQKIAQPIRVSITGTSVSPGIFETMELVGRDKTIQRIEKVVSRL